MILKNRYFILLAALLVAPFLMVACSPTGEHSTQITMSELIGLWNSSENNNAKTDIIFTRITSDGAIIEYDFDGDEVDQGLNCYQIDSGSIKPLAANRFLVTTDMHDNKQFEVELEVLDAGQALNVHFMDKDEASKILKSQIWTRETDDSILDSEPSCKNLR